MNEENCREWKTNQLIYLTFVRQLSDEAKFLGYIMMNYWLGNQILEDEDGGSFDSSYFSGPELQVLLEGF